MVDRLSWFMSGLVLGGVVVVRALHRSPRGLDLRGAAIHTGADLLSMAARAIRPPPRPVRVLRVNEAWNGSKAR